MLAPRGTQSWDFGAGRVEGLQSGGLGLRMGVHRWRVGEVGGKNLLSRWTTCWLKNVCGLVSKATGVVEVEVVMLVGRRLEIFK